MRISVCLSNVSRRPPTFEFFLMCPHGSVRRRRGLSAQSIMRGSASRRVFRFGSLRRLRRAITVPSPQGTDSRANHGRSNAEDGGMELSRALKAHHPASSVLSSVGIPQICWSRKYRSCRSRSLLAAACICQQPRRNSLAAAASCSAFHSPDRIAPPRISIPDAGPFEGIRDCLFQHCQCSLGDFLPGGLMEQRRLGYLHAVARDRKRQQQAQFFGFQVPAIGRHVCGSTEIRVAIWAGPIRSPASERSGPRRPPQPEIVWQYSQPLSSKTLAPSAIGPVATPTTDAGKGGASSRGDHGARAPAQPPSFRPGVLRLWRWRIRLQAVLLVGSHGGRQRCVP